MNKKERTCAQARFINKTQAKIIFELRKNARNGFSDISRVHNVPVTTIFDNYQSLLKTGIVKKYACVVDFKRLGYSYRSFIFIKSARKEMLLNYLQNHECVNSLFRIDKYDFFADCVFRTVRDFYDLLDSLSAFEISAIEHHDFLENVLVENFKI